MPRTLLRCNAPLLCLQFDLGTTSNYRPFEEARKHVLALKLTSQSEFRLWAISTQRPADIPYNPTRIYSDKWISWEHFLGISTELYQLVKQLQAENYTLKSANAKLKSNNAELKSNNAELKSNNAELKSNNAKLAVENAKLKERIQTTAVHAVENMYWVCLADYLWF